MEMNDNKMIKLKENYQIFRSADDIMVYDKEKELVFLKFTIKGISSIIKKDLNALLLHFNHLDYLHTFVEGKIILSLYQKYPDLFEAGSSVKAFIDDARSYEWKNTVDFELFFSTYEFSEDYFERVVVLWGASQANLLVMDHFARLSLSVTLVVSEQEVIQPQETLYWHGISGSSIASFAEYAKNRYAENENIRIVIFEQMSQRDLLFAEDSIHIVNQRVTENDPDSKLSVALNRAKAGTILYYGFYEKELVLGPIVVPGETATYKDFKEAYSEDAAGSTVTLNFIAAGMIFRTACYLLAKSLKYLAADAQLPLDSLFCINRYSLNSRIIYLKRGI